MALVEFAKEELERAGLFDKDSDYGGELGKEVLSLIERFAETGHSGFSAAMTVNLFSKLAMFKPITPLTGEDDEWGQISDDAYQNKRCATVFKDSTGAYNIDGKVFREPDGVCFTSKDSKVYITFPYTPTTEYVDVPKGD